MSRVPPYDPPDLAPKPDLNMVRQVREYRLITPLFGGGVEPRTADPISTVRATEVRGQLRFWWRATRGGQFGADLSALKHAEDLLWGAASSKEHDRPSKVQVEVQVLDAGKPFTPPDGRPLTDMRSAFGYVSFPLQKTDAVVREGVRFRLILSYPTTYQPDLDAALWAWETFGGLGARTRRGFGAIARETPEPLIPPASDLHTARQWIEHRMANLQVTGTWFPNIPYLYADVVLFPFHPDPIQVWQTLIAHLKNFRQQRPQHPRWYRDRKTNTRKQRPMPGRNHWPEPDEIRRRTRSRANFTDPDGNVHDHTHDVSTVEAFPRAAFGLPIQFEFKDRASGDPAGKNLLRGVIYQHGEPELIERLASPIILRPIPWSDGYRGLVLRLAGTQPPDDLDINVARGSRSARWRLTVGEATSIPEFDDRGTLLPDPLMRDTTGSVPTDVLEGFFNFLRRNGGV
ncbi:type III-B CRISPR module RAMP protein Cmr1 [Candidatus Oscillochloris fontis]|uniref:type III-B CRISPR module RAMP protein Cmr1 n=1 Tax=Candidatus Oscillochloris fontis TaxID=2496868 RepID=UPI00101BC228|nr:type III-B CRISPR module RAMP protein Cmr1 [Candidatus Oscillochloris fontis]